MANDSHSVKPKRVIKLTAKALAEKLEKLQDERKTKLNKASNLRKRLSELMQEGKNTEVQCSLDHLVELCGEATCVQDSLMALMGLLDEKDKRDIWFKAKMISNNECISHVKRCLTGVEHQTLMGNDDDDDRDVDDNDGVNPEDSVSNVTNKHTSKRSACSGHLPPPLPELKQRLRKLL